MDSIRAISKLASRTVPAGLLDILRAVPVGGEIYKTDIVTRYSEKYGSVVTRYIHVLLNMVERAGYIKQVDKLANKTKIRVVRELPDAWGEIAKRATNNTKDVINTVLLDNSGIYGAEPGKIYPIQFILTTQVHYITGQVLICLVQYIESNYTNQEALKEAINLLLTARRYNVNFKIFSGKTKLLEQALDKYIAQEKLPPLIKDLVFRMQESYWTEALETILKLNNEAIANKG